MYRFKSIHHVPPRSYRFKDPDTGAEISAKNYNVWSDAIAAHRKANNLPPIDIAVAEDQNCMRLPAEAAEEFCTSTDPKPTTDGVTLGIGDIMRGSAFLLGFKLAGSPLVDEAEANRRANICAYCPMNVRYRQPCSGFCGELLELVERIVGGKRTAKDGDLHACSACKCVLAAKVWVQKDFIRSMESADIHARYDSRCWMLDNPSTQA